MKEKITVGDIAESSVKVTSSMIDAFARLSGDANPIHLDEEYASQTIFKQRIAHGILIASFISALIANELPGEGAIYLQQDLKFLKPVYIDDEVTTTVEVISVIEAKNIIELATRCSKNGGEMVIDGTALIKI